MKYSAIFAEVKGYFGITAPDNQLGQRSSRSLRGWNKIDSQLDKCPSNGHYNQLKRVIGVSRHHNCRNVFDVTEQGNWSHNFWVVFIAKQKQTFWGCKAGRHICRIGMLVIIVGTRAAWNLKLWSQGSHLGQKSAWKQSCPLEAARNLLL